MCYIPANLILFDLVTPVIFHHVYKLWTTSLCQHKIMQHNVLLWWKVISPKPNPKIGAPHLVSWLRLLWWQWTHLTWSSQERTLKFSESSSNVIAANTIYMKKNMRLVSKFCWAVNRFKMFWSLYCEKFICYTTKFIRIIRAYNLEYGDRPEVFHTWIYNKFLWLWQVLIPTSKQMFWRINHWICSL